MKTKFILAALLGLQAIKLKDDIDDMAMELDTGEEVKTEEAQEEPKKAQEPAPKAPEKKVEAPKQVVKKETT